MTIGESIYSSATKTVYVICQTLSNSGQAELAYAKSNRSDKVFFIKKLINVKYVTQGVKHERSVEFENERKRIYRTINSNTLPGATCSYIHDFFRERTFYYVVTERVEGVPLNSFVVSKALSLEDRLALFRRIVYSFLPFERGGIIHGDVKPDNILLKKVESQLTIRLIDFETSFFSSAPPLKGFIVGTEPYYSPEMALYNDENNGVGKEVLSTKSDVFSLGIILFELLTGHYPAPCNGDLYCYEVVSKGKSINFPSNWSKALQTLVMDMLSLQPSMRPSIMDVVERLKTLPDKSLSPIEVFPPEIIIFRISEDVASVSLFCYNPNSEIEYSLDRGEICQYKDPFIIDDDDIDIDFYVRTNVGSKTIKKCFSKSISVSAKRTVKVPRPTISIDGGIVSIFCANNDASIYFTLDGTIPTKHSNRYIGAFSVGEKVMIKAFARCLGMLPSDVASINSSSRIKMS